LKIGFPYKFFEKFLLKRRAQVLNKFFEAMNPSPTDVCLEIGGPTYSMSEVTSRFKDYMVVNMDAHFLKINSTYYTGTYYPLVADGCRLPIKDDGVDFVFGNAILEHVPREQRQSFVREIRRVCHKGYFLANDNHWFPLDPHYLVPFYQFLPHSFKRFVSRYVSFKWHPKGDYDPIDLLTIKEYRKLFPGARYEGLRFPFSPIAESIIVWQRNDLIGNKTGK
jgi:ubiquinone/menaquinone biosynthesis C-methylase UbiE